MTWKRLILKVAKQEGKKKSVDIAQLSESTKIVFQILGSMKAADAATLIAKYGRAKR